MQLIERIERRFRTASKRQLSMRSCRARVRPACNRPGSWNNTYCPHAADADSAVGRLAVARRQAVASPRKCGLERERDVSK